MSHGRIIAEAKQMKGQLNHLIEVVSNGDEYIHFNDLKITKQTLIRDVLKDIALCMVELTFAVMKD